MGRLVVTEFLSVDGVYEELQGALMEPRMVAGHQVDRGEEGNRFKLDELMAADAQLLGRTTYEGFARAWPAMQGTGAFGEKMNAMPKYVVYRDAAGSNLGEHCDHPRGGPRGSEAPQGALRRRYSGGRERPARPHPYGERPGRRDPIIIFPLVLGRGKRLFERRSHDDPPAGRG